MMDRRLPAGILASILSAAALLNPAVLCAQTSDSASVDAIANLVQAEIPLSIAGISVLNFGQITIPDNQDILCVYDIASDGRRTITDSRQVGQVFGDGPTPAKCAFRDGGADRAAFTLRCQEGMSVSFLVRSESATPSGGAVFFETFETYMEVDGAFIYAWDNRCLDRDIALRIGGRLMVSGSAEPSAGNFQVGTISIEAQYQ